MLEKHQRKLLKLFNSNVVNSRDIDKPKNSHASSLFARIGLTEKILRNGLDLTNDIDLKTLKCLLSKADYDHFKSEYNLETTSEGTHIEAPRKKEISSSIHDSIEDFHSGGQKI